MAIEELDELTMGMVSDMFVEKANDEFRYAYKAMQEDYDKF